MRRAALHNLGCKVNAYETEAMQQLLENAGYEIVDFEDVADVYIINTCSVTNMADKKSRQMLHRARAKNPNAVVVAVGCYVQSATEKLKEDESIDLLIGNNKKAELVFLLEEYFSGHKAKGLVIDIASERQYEGLMIEHQADHTRAFIKIQDGCNQFCSYCIIPYTRGRVRSRRPEDVEREILGLIQNGYREFVLTGIHLSSYGVDFEKESISLLSLIKSLHELEGVRRLRLGSLEPRIITEAFVRELAGLEKFCPHFHLSLQSGCDATLKRMNRHYGCDEYFAGCERLRTWFKNPAITTDVIVGFPGETKEEFEQTKRFLKKVNFYEMHVFKYSRRAGTRADRMPNQVMESVKTMRGAELIRLAKEMSVNYRKSFLGMETEVLLEEEVEIYGVKYLMGHTKEYIKAAVLLQENSSKIRKNCLVKGVLFEFLTEEIIILAEIVNLG